MFIGITCFAYAFKLPQRLILFSQIDVDDVFSNMGVKQDLCSTKKTWYVKSISAVKGRVA